MLYWNSVCIGSIIWLCQVSFLLPLPLPYFFFFPSSLQPWSSIPLKPASIANSGDTVSELSLPGRPRYCGITLSDQAPCHLHVLRERERKGRLGEEDRKDTRRDGNIHTQEWKRDVKTKKEEGGQDEIRVDSSVSF